VDLSADDVAYWNARRPSDCQHQDEPLTSLGGQAVKYCSQKYFVGIKANGEKYEKEWLLYSSSTEPV